MSTKVSEYYQVGDVIYEGIPFTKILHRDLWDKVCANCHAGGGSLKKCGSCKTMKYCGNSCQKEAWSNHKFECPFLPGYKDFRNQVFVQVVGNTILKLQGRDWKSVTERVMDKEVSFDDLISHTGTKNDPSFFLDIKTIKESLASYIGEQKLPDERSLKEIIGKVLYNQFSFYPLMPNNPFIPSNFNSEGRALFIGASKFDHSCVPNSTRAFNGHTFSVIATKAIRKKTEKVTFPYVSLVVSLDASLNLEKMKGSFLNGCECDDCSQPIGESVLTKVIDMPKAYPVLEESRETLLLVSLLNHLKYPTGIVTRDRLKQLLEKQKKVLGKTHLLRMRTLALRCLFLDGPNEDLQRDLMELEDAMISAWGENFEELVFVYQKLVEVNTRLLNFEGVAIYFKKMNKLFFNVSHTNTWKEAQDIMKTVNLFMFNRMNNMFLP